LLTLHVVQLTNSFHQLTVLDVQSLYLFFILLLLSLDLYHQVLLLLHEFHDNSLDLFLVVGCWWWWGYVPGLRVLALHDGIRSRFIAQGIHLQFQFTVLVLQFRLARQLLEPLQGLLLR
jgi:hypothetical protein